MKMFNIQLVKESPISLVSAAGATGAHELVGEKFDWDFVVRDADGAEKLRINREHIIYVEVSEYTPTVN